MSAAEIQCVACGKVSLLLREPVYEGFTKVGEILKCTACGYVYESEDDLPLLHKPKAKPLFSEKDLPAGPHVFVEGEAEALCHHCLHYTVNPFLQWCGLHRKEVDATDSCAQFEPKPVVEEESPDEKPKDPTTDLKRILGDT